MPLPFTHDAGMRALFVSLLRDGHQLVRKMSHDRFVGLAAQLAFFAFLALFPALLFLVALIASLPLEGAVSRALFALAAVAPFEVVVLLREQLEAIEAGEHGGLLTMSIAAAIWSSSVAMVSMIDALNVVFGVTERRPWWKRRLVGLMLTIALSVFSTAALGLVLLGADLVLRLAVHLQVKWAAAILLSILRWPVAVVLLMFTADLIYYFAPNRRTEWRWITRGSLVATALWILASFGFRLYIVQMDRINATYGAIGGIVVVLLWFYVSSFAILIGAEVNAARERTPIVDRAAEDD